MKVWTPDAMFFVHGQAVPLAPRGRPSKDGPVDDWWATPQPDAGSYQTLVSYRWTEVPTFYHVADLGPTWVCITSQLEVSGLPVPRRNTTERERVLLYSRDGGRCGDGRKCDNGPVSLWDDADHIFGYAIGGPHEIWNMRLLCAPCNRSRGVEWPSQVSRLYRSLDDACRWGDHRVCDHIQTGLWQ